jgi:hypothetical protein
MFGEANTVLSQQLVIKPHLRSKVGNKLFIPDYKFRDSVTNNITMPRYGTYNYVSSEAKAKKQRPEKVNYCTYNKTYALCKGILLSANHGKGAWRCHAKLYTHSVSYKQRFQDASKFGKHISAHESGAQLDQVAHIACKNDHPDVLENSVAADLNKGFAKIKKTVNWLLFRIHAKNALYHD